MIDKQNTPFTISEDDIPAILRVCGEEKDPNFQDVEPRDIPNYLRERYWIKQWNRHGKRWKNRVISVSFAVGGQHFVTADLGRKLNDPGDAFFELFLSTAQSIVHVFALGWRLQKFSYRRRTCRKS